MNIVKGREVITMEKLILHNKDSTIRFYILVESLKVSV